jgi:DNA-binding GntR family transcriptional regulator
MAEKISAALAPLQHQSAPLRNKIIAALRGAIEAGVLRPGVRLIERDLCEQLNVSRTSLREALRELQAQGILTHVDNRGLAVAMLTREDAENAYRLRAVVEALIVQQFIERADEEELARLEADGLVLKRAYQSGSVERILASKHAFYDRICSGAQNALAFDIINGLVLRTSSLRTPSLARKERQQQSVKEIDAILEAIRARNVAAAKRAAIAHVESAAVAALGEATGLPGGKASAKPARATRRKAASA